MLAAITVHKVARIKSLVLHQTSPPVGPIGSLCVSSCFVPAISSGRVLSGIAPSSFLSMVLKTKAFRLMRCDYCGLKVARHRDSAGVVEAALSPKANRISSGIPNLPFCAR